MYGLNKKLHVHQVRNPLQVAKFRVTNPIKTDTVAVENRTRTEIVPLPDPGGAAVDMTTKTVWVAPEACVINQIKFWQMVAATADPAAAANDMDVTIRNATGPITLVTKNFVAAVDGDPTTLGTLANNTLAAGDLLQITIDQKGTCDISATCLQIEWTPRAQAYTGRTIWKAPEACTIRDVQVAFGEAYGAAPANHTAFLVQDATAAAVIGTLTTAGSIAADTPTTIGTLTTTTMAKDAEMTLDITLNGSAANPPDMLWMITYSPVAEDYTDRTIFVAPKACTLKRILWVGEGALAAAAGAGALDMTIKNATGPVTVVTKSFVANVAANTPTSLGAFTGSPALAADDEVTLDVTIGTAGLLPNGELQVEYYEGAKTFAGETIFTAAEKLAIDSISLTNHGTAVAAASPNDIVMAIKNPTGAAGGGSVTLLTATYNNVTAPPAAETTSAMATILAGTLTNYYMDAGEKLTLDETLGILATIPDHDIEIWWHMRDTVSEVGP